MSKVALITGANSGIGKALALEFKSRGVKVYATDISFSKETSDLFESQGILTQILDVTIPEHIVKARERVQLENDGKLDYLYGNAGIAKVKHATDVTDDDYNQLYNINFLGNIRLVREFVRLVINAKGTIIFSGSVTKSLPIHSNCLYSSSKAALDQYGFVLHTELKNYGVRVYNVLGGSVTTNIFNSGVSSVPETSVFNFDEYTDVFKQRSEKLKEAASDGMDADVFAKRVLDQVEKAGPDIYRLYEGTKSTTIYWGSLLLGAKLLSAKMLNLFGLNFDYRKHLKDDRIDLQ